MSSHYVAMEYDRLREKVKKNYNHIAAGELVVYIPKGIPILGDVRRPTMDDVLVNQGDLYNLVKPTAEQREFIVKFLGEHGQEPVIKDIADILML